MDESGGSDDDDDDSVFAAATGWTRVFNPVSHRLMTRLLFSCVHQLFT